MVTMYKLDIHVIIHRNRVETLLHFTLFGDRLSIVEELVHLVA